MISHPTPSSARPDAAPTIWGLTPTQLYDRFWASRGVQVVRLGEPSEIVSGAELFLLTESRVLTIFKITRLVEFMSWIKPDVLYIRLHDDRERGYRERVITGPDNRFLRFERLYEASDSRQARVALTPDRRLAQIWQKAPDPRTGWHMIRQEIQRGHRSVLSVRGDLYDRTDDAEVVQCVRQIVQVWKRPDATIQRARKVQQNAWADQGAEVGGDTRLIGPVWVGAGRRIHASTSIIGPRILWDDPAARPPIDTLQWHEIEPTPSFDRPVRYARHTLLGRAAKRVFDILFASLALLLTLPIYPLVMLAIWLEDGRPFFFTHQRETLGGREFGCIKFRSMRKDADQIKKQLLEKNQADGPQFFIDNDPRLTRVGAFLRKANIDELPQFINVLLGHMGIVGPRPSPFTENQYCPPWRDARLSVRPGITGLWQVKRTRRKGLDFQEWIRYDIEYVENAGWWLDLKIIVQTVALIIREITRS
jgi:lipopolysaccharide/colanic/teichoic acid biosynthesis glycosyltransferase